MPFPDPVAPVRTVIHETLDAADHAHPPGIATATLLFPPAAEMACAAGLREASQAAPAWVITKGWPATVIVADRELLSGFAATTYPTAPVPVPEVAVEKVTQDAGLWADQAQPDPAVMFTVPEPADAVSDALAGEML